MKTKRQEEIEKYFQISWKMFARNNKGFETKEKALNKMEDIMRKQISGLYHSIKL